MSVQDSLPERLARRLGGTANAGTIFGAPVKDGEVTVIPVAKAAYAFRGGRGTGSDEKGSGGGAVKVAPVGYIEIRSGVVLYRPIRHRAIPIPALAAGGLMILAAAHGIARLVRQ